MPTIFLEFNVITPTLRGLQRTTCPPQPRRRRKCFNDLNERSVPSIDAIMIRKINNIAGMTPVEMGRLESVFEKESAISELMLYGSRAKGTHRPGSDIDLIVTGSKLSTRWLMELSGKIDDLLLPYEVDISILDHIDNPDLLDHIKRVGKVVFRNE